MSLKNSVHYNYLLIGKKHIPMTILNETIFFEIKKMLLPILEKTNIAKVRINVIQYADKKQGRLSWKDEKLLPVINEYKNESGDFSFSHLSAEFPSIDSAYKNGTTSEVFIVFENDKYLGKINSEGECGFFLSLREDIFESLGKDKVLETVKSISSLFDECKILYHKRTWWYSFDIKEQLDNESEEEALQDVSPYRALDNLTKKLYSNWVEIKL